MEGLWKVVRGMKAGSNVQFQHGDFILDLSYITERVIGRKDKTSIINSNFRFDAFCFILLRPIFYLAYYLVLFMHSIR